MYLLLRYYSMMGLLTFLLLGLFYIFVMFLAFFKFYFFILHSGSLLSTIYMSFLFQDRLRLCQFRHKIVHDIREQASDISILQEEVRKDLTAAK